jgi:hypothetical protein
MMLNLMPIPHVFQMNDIIPMSRTTNNSGRHLLTTGADVRDSQARSNDIGGMFARRATFLSWLKITSKQTAVGCSTKHNVVTSRRTHHKHDTAPVSLYHWHTITFCSFFDHENCGQEKPENDHQTKSRC